MILPNLDANETIYQTADRMYDWLRMHGFAVTMFQPDDLELDPKLYNTTNHKINMDTLEGDMLDAGLAYINWIKDATERGRNTI